MTTNQLTDWMAFTMLPGMGPILQHRALEQFGDPGVVAFRIPPEMLRALARGRGGTTEEIRHARKDLRKRAERELRRCRRHSIDVIVRNHPDYPAALLEIPDPPVLLYRRGAMAQDVLRVAVVGSRNATRYGERLAAGLASGLAARGIEVVSGGARGIDSLAHKAAIAEGGRTVAVLASGLFEPYPRGNEELFDRIAESGALLSEFPLDLPPSPGQFPRRNRLISGLCAAVVVIEAGGRSGSLITAKHALEQGREVLAVPGPVTSPRSQGCHALIQQGAKLVQNIEDILEELPPNFRAAASTAIDSHPPPNLDSLSADEVEIISILDSVEPTHLDELATEALFGISRLQAALVGLELRSVVEALPGGYFLLCNIPGALEQSPKMTN